MTLVEPYFIWVELVVKQGFTLLRRLDGWMTISGSTLVYKWDGRSSRMLTSEALGIMACDWTLLVAWSEIRRFGGTPSPFSSSSSSLPCWQNLNQYEAEDPTEQHDTIHTSCLKINWQLITTLKPIRNQPPLLKSGARPNFLICDTILELWTTVNKFSTKTTKRNNNSWAERKNWKEKNHQKN